MRNEVSRKMRGYRKEDVTVQSIKLHNKLLRTLGQIFIKYYISRVMKTFSRMFARPSALESNAGGSVSFW
jgi:hypothetical protein